MLHADLGFIDRLTLRAEAGDTAEVYWLQQRWAIGAGLVAGSELWRATRSSTGWSATMLRKVDDGSIDDVRAWGGSQPGVAWVETTGTASRLLAAVVSPTLAEPDVIATAKPGEILDIRAESATDQVVLAWRADACAGSTTAIRQDAGASANRAAVNTNPQSLLACMTVKRTGSTWNGIRNLGSLVGTAQDTLGLALKPSGESMIVWSGSIGAMKQVVATHCTATSCTPAQILSTPNMGPIAKPAVAATASGFAVSWVDIDPYAPHLTALALARFTAAGAIVGSPTTVRGVFYGTGLSPVTKEPAIVASGDNLLLGWRIERYNTDSTSDFNAAWLTP